MTSGQAHAVGGRQGMFVGLATWVIALSYWRIAKVEDRWLAGTTAPLASGESVAS